MEEGRSRGGRDLFATWKLRTRARLVPWKEARKTGQVFIFYRNANGFNTFQIDLNMGREGFGEIHFHEETSIGQ